MIPGEYQIQKGDIELNVGRRTVQLTVANSGDRQIQVGSHYHFFETNDALAFDRAAARGMRLNIPAGTAVRFGYRGTGAAPAERSVEPWVVGVHDGHWYVHGWDRDRQAPRVFRASRIETYPSPAGAAQQPRQARVRAERTQHTPVNLEETHVPAPAVRGSSEEAPLPPPLRGFIRRSGREQGNGDAMGTKSARLRREQPARRDELILRRHG